jgi:anaerobic magnesium-protoporphyrin IX monomethyl ester cyclase
MQATIDFYDIGPSADKQHFRVALVGVEFEENLSLRYLAGALGAAGYPAVEVLPYNGIRDAAAVAAHIVSSRAALVGISMAFQTRAVEDMALVQLLREAGFEGHITAGGQFATLHYTEIFQDCAGLDSIVRFEAEATIVQLAAAIAQPAPALHAVPGLVWREANGQVSINHSAPEPGDINLLPLPLRHSERAKHLGFKTAHMLGSRGCHATCKYCCVAALATERRQAGRAAGNTNALPGTRRRTPANVAAEIAQLYFEHEIRIFEFQDDNWIPPKVATAVAYFTELKAELIRHGVGQIGLALKTRADSVHPEILTVLKEIGLIRLFVGIESGTQELLTRLGRKARDNASLHALQTLRNFRVPAYFNALLFGPDIKFAELEPELEFLEQCADFPFEIVEVVIYGKTGLYQSLSAEGRLHGNYLEYDYDYLEETTQRTHALVSQLDTRHFGVYSPAKMAADLGFNLGIMQVFYPGSSTDYLAEQVAALTRDINFDQVRIIRRAAALACLGTPVVAARASLRAETVTADLNFYRRIIELHHRMEQLVHQARPGQPAPTCYYRAGALVQSAMLAGLFALLAGSAQAQQPKSAADKERQQATTRLTRHFNGHDWRLVKPQLTTQDGCLADSPLGQNIEAKRRNGLFYDQRTAKHLERLRKQRVRHDYHELRRILERHNPKISVASTLLYYTDSEGIVRRVAGIDISAQMQQTIVALLQKQRFRAHEARPCLPEKDMQPPEREYVLRGPTTFHERAYLMRRRFKRKMTRTLIKLHLKKGRRGPMD